VVGGANRAEAPLRVQRIAPLPHPAGGCYAQGMRLSQRVRQLVRGELATVHQHLDDVLASIDEATAAREAHFAAGISKDMFGDKRRVEANPEAASWNLKELGYAWAPVLEALEAWLEHGESTYFPAIHAWSGGDDDALDGLHAAVQERQRLAGEFLQRLAPLRAQANFIPPVKRPIMNLISAVEIVQRVDDVELNPSILSGQRETSQQATGRSADRYRTSDDVARSLRSARPITNDPEPLPKERVKSTGWIGRLTGFLKKG